MLFTAFPGQTEESGPVYVLGNFAFGMTFQSVRALDQQSAGRYETDGERNLQCITFLSDNFIVNLWFDGLTEDAPLIEMDFAFYTAPDAIGLKDNRLEVQTSPLTVSAVYTYVENLCKKNFGQGTNVKDNALPFSSLLFDEADSPDLTRLRVYTLPDGKRTDIIVHLIAAGDYSVNYLICRQSEDGKP